VIGTLLVAHVAVAAPVRDGSDDPHPGIHHEHWTDASIPASLDLVRIDLTSSEIGAYATMESEAGMTTSAYAAKLDAQVAINGDSFTANGFVPRGLAMGSGSAWTDTTDDAVSALLHFARVEETTQAAIDPPEAIETAGDLPAGTQGVVSGHPLLVRAGAVVPSFDCTDAQAIACERAPRSAAALSADGTTLTLVVVDGWQTSSLGMTDAELAAFLVARGASVALALDSGASSTLVMDGAVVNHPSDGVERAVANHLAFKYGALPKGQLVGLVCKHDVFGCDSDSSRWIANAKVKLDDGRGDTTPSGEVPLYDFTGVTPRLACVTVKADGYLTVHQCQQVQAGEQTYNSVALWEGTDAIDAGVIDASGVAPDAMSAAGGDGGATGDGGRGNPAAGGGGGCCDAGGDPPPLGGCVFLALGWFALRRLGTKR
jgi:exopolysaccharide biosynthesis protein